MSLARNKQVVCDLIEQVWRQGCIEALPTFWTEDCINHADPSPDRQGLAALRRYHEGFGPWFQDFADVAIEVMQQVAEGDTVATRIAMRAVHKGKDRKVSFETIRIDRIADGRIAEHWSVADIAGLMQQVS